MKGGDKKMEEQKEEVDLLEGVDEFNSLTDLSSDYIKGPKVGENVEFVCKGFKIIKDKSVLEFTFEKDGKQKTASSALSNVDFGIQLHTDTNAIYWVSSWSVWGQLKGIAKKLGSTNLAGLEIQIDHPLNGMLEENRDKAWVVRTKVDGVFKALNRDTGKWE